MMTCNNSIFTVEGNIGAGKSTALNYIRGKLNIEQDYVIILEPVDEWLKFKPAGCDKSLFELFYQDNKKYGFSFQLYALQSRYKYMLETMYNNPGKVIICERSPMTDNEIFAKMLLNDGIISPYEYEIYCGWHSLINEILEPNIKGIIYLKTSNEVCASRVIHRHRSGEGGISMDYLEKLNKQHDIWLEKEQVIPILTLDGNKTVEEIDIKSIETFMSQNSSFCL
jgi:deoxyadenosine/deoxycytidine kinase